MGLMRANWIVPCNLIDFLVGHRPIFFGVFRRIGVASFPARLDPFMVAVEIEADPHECDVPHDMEIRLVDGDGRPYFSVAGQVAMPKRPDMSPSYEFHPFRIAPELEVPGPGVFRIDILCDGEIIGESRIEVVAGSEDGR